MTYIENKLISGKDASAPPSPAKGLSLAELTRFKSAGGVSPNASQNANLVFALAYRSEHAC